MVHDVEREVEAFCFDHESKAKMYANGRTAQCLLDSLIRAWCSFPGEASLEVLKEVRASVDQNNFDADHLVRPWQFRDAVKGLLPEQVRRALNISMWRPVWPEAAVRASKGWPLRLVRFRQKVVSSLNMIRHGTSAWRHHLP
jgi:hypothetical protein